MTKAKSLWLLATAAALAGTGISAAIAQPAGGDVRAGIDAWAAQNYDQAIAIWRPLADRGDADAQYNLAQAYFLGRGVPQNMTLAEQWYARAARQGHPEATANYGLLLFQNGRRQEAIPFITRAADAGDPRAQYVLGTALFNGDVIGRDAPRAYALMTQAAAQNLPPAVSQLAEMDRLMSPQDRARGVELARDMRTAPPPLQIAARPAQNPPHPQIPVRTQTRPRTAPTPSVRTAGASATRERQTDQKGTSDK
jgi:tetratricopeptide (TPR) repeat protein